MQYDVLSSGSPADFRDSTECLETDDLDTVAVDPATPTPDSVTFYLIRVENACPGPHPVGIASNGVFRRARSCP